MAYLRIALIVLSIVAALALLGMLKNAWMYRSDEVAMMWVVLVGLGLNLIYLSFVSPTKPIGLFNRPARIFRLWLDAKEADLERRSTRSAD